jgi:hypothetical protein
LIIEALHTSPQALDRDQHRGLKLQLPVSDWSVARRLNAIFVAAVEFADVAREYPIVFVRAGKEADGREQIAPIAVMGLQANQNLYETDGKWRASYLPAVVRFYPFCIGRIDAERFAVCIDAGWIGAQPLMGERLFQDDGQPSPMLQEMQKQMEVLEAEIQRTRLIGQRLQEHGLLQEMRFDATMPDGRQHSVDGFLTVDDKKLQDLPDAVVGQLHREGVLGLIHAHWLSMGHMRRLVDWFAERNPKPAGDATGRPQAANS